MLLAANPFSVFMDPLVAALGGVLTAIHSVIPSYGWSMIVLAAIVRLFLWPLSAMQFKSMAEMQKVAPLLKQLQAKYKSEPQKLQQEQMALYKEHNVNPFAGCLPMVIPIPILIGLFYAIQHRIGEMQTEHWLWIGSPISRALPHVFAQDLAGQDIFLLLLYVVSMYFTVRFGSPPSQDPQQAQTQKIMAFVSPAMIAYFGFQYKWAAALYIYWLAMNVFTVGQQLYMYRKFGISTPIFPIPAAADAEKNVTPAETRKALADAGANGKQPRAKKRANR